MAPKPGFQVISEEEAPAQHAAPGPDPRLAQAQAESARATQILMLALRTVSQRAVVAIFNAFTAVAVGSAWVLWYSVLPNPNVYQLVGCGLYAVFLLAVEIIRRRSAT